MKRVKYTQKRAKYTHDCDGCEFLGQDGDLDMYTCMRGPGRTFIARYGSRGPEYASVPAIAIAAAGESKSLHVVAIIRAAKRFEAGLRAGVSREADE